MTLSSSLWGRAVPLDSFHHRAESIAEQNDLIKRQSPPRLNPAKARALHCRLGTNANNSACRLLPPSDVYPGSAHFLLFGNQNSRLRPRSAYLATSIHAALTAHFLFSASPLAYSPQPSRSAGILWLFNHFRRLTSFFLSRETRPPARRHRHYEKTIRSKDKRFLRSLTCAPVRANLLDRCFCQRTL